MLHIEVLNGEKRDGGVCENLNVFFLILLTQSFPRRVFTVSLTVVSLSSPLKIWIELDKLEGA